MSVILTARDDQLCPCTALQNHLNVNCDAPGTSSLFAYVGTDGRWEHMTKYRFMDFCTDIWSKAALAHVLGHSFRIGGAVELLLAGVPPELQNRRSHRRLDFTRFPPILETDGGDPSYEHLKGLP